MCICGNCIAMTTAGRESVCCREHQKSCDKIPPAMSCITENENFSAVCTNPAVIETAFNQYLEMKAPLMMNHLRLKGVDRLNTTPVVS